LSEARNRPAGTGQGGKAPVSREPAPATAPGARAAGGEAPLVLMLSGAHPPTDLRIVGKEGAALAAAGWRVAHMAPAPLRGARDVPAAQAGVEILTYPRVGGLIGRLRAAKALARRAAKLRPAVIHAHEPDSWYAAILAARETGAAVVLDVHEHYPSRLDTRLPGIVRGLGRRALRAALAWMAARADAVVVAKDGLEDAFPGVAVVPVRNYAVAVPVQPRAHRHGPVTLVHLGSLTRERGAFEMLRALNKCPEGTRLSLIGRFNDASETDFLAEAKRLAVSGAVERHGWLPHEEAVRLAAEADIGLVLFQPGHENHRLALPHKLFDCMLAGLPVIVPNFAEEVAEVVRQTGCGVLVDTADPDTVAEAVRALSDPHLRAEMGAAGRAAALGRYGWAGEAERLVRLYEELAPLRTAEAAPAPRPAQPVPDVPVTDAVEAPASVPVASPAARPAAAPRPVAAAGVPPTARTPAAAPARDAAPRPATPALRPVALAGLSGRVPGLPATRSPIRSLAAPAAEAPPPAAMPDVPVFSLLAPPPEPRRLEAAPEPGTVTPAGPAVPRLLLDAALGAGAPMPSSLSAILAREAEEATPGPPHHPLTPGERPPPSQVLGPAPETAPPPGRPAEAPPSPSLALGSMVQALRMSPPPTPAASGPSSGTGAPAFALLAGLRETDEAPRPVPAPAPLPARPVPPAPAPAGPALTGRLIEVPPGEPEPRLLYEAGLEPGGMPPTVEAVLLREPEPPPEEDEAMPVASDVPLVAAGLRSAGRQAPGEALPEWRLLRPGG